jgi:hypothetical protein
MKPCAWCARPFPPNPLGRPKVYCSGDCRRAHGRHAESLSEWQTELAHHEAAAASYGRIHRPVPTFLRNEITMLRDLIARR